MHPTDPEKQEEEEEENNTEKKCSININASITFIKEYDNYHMFWSIICITNILRELKN